ncbi:MAG TPA: tRNA lysidine(34) synthetase TilS [Thermoanaerobaculia bacterium]|jgi:tRNA(Ile)-lysidine synthase
MLVSQVRRAFDAPCRVLAAVSGGADSTALLVALAELRGEGFEVVAAHVNHHLRGDDSDADEAFVRALCARLGVTLHVADGTLDDDAVKARGIEAAAREVRYARLQSIRETANAQWIATAHQRNDQAETVLMRLLTGSGIAGLRGIHRRRDDAIVRPLLEVTRAEVEAFLHERHIVPRHDRSNDDRRFLRNRVRAIVRELDAVDPLVHLAEQAREQWPLLERAIDQAERACATIAQNETRFERWPDERWLRGALLQRHIRRLDPTARDFDAARIAGELDSIKRLHVTRNVELLRLGDALVLRRKLEEMPAFELELRRDAFIPELQRTIRIGEGERGRGQRFQLPQGAEPRFTVRNRRDGDRFQPLGMPQPKKLKDFLIDRRIPAGDRDRLPLLIWNGEIVWVGGVEISERFKIDGETAGERYEVWLE